MKLFSVCYFDNIEWRHTEKKILANDEQEVITFINKICSPQFRDSPYSKNMDKKVDSLKITYEDEITFPIDLDILI